MVNRIPYNPRLIPLAKKLRHQGILSEVIMWGYLKNKQLRGFAFYRQRPIDEYIVDFYCAPLNLVIEIDGVTHADKIQSDLIRDNRLKYFGLTVLRFSDSIVKQDVDSVLRTINNWIIDNPPRPSGTPPPANGTGIQES